ncbi:MAG: 3'(2'),5'-bisphosphate nucleotidase CysQ [Bacteroidetes bacterium]|nr:3'(2'),5'-bisphosphate nucleotidase CysQ [Bacteroidota bacterium]MDA0903479.1 3'(2'),5'-bisphosphate nucleotidase CysQ [Bacteroidota bacterium]MDA1241936.1 3'(2'),5'-bisphosphate nucleotidase CysQ [Bacteroidota bacterium]
MNDLTRCALEAALHAGRAIMEIYNSGDFGVESKSDNSPLTQADRAAHELIVERLRETGIPVLSEEGKHLPFNTRQTWSTLWIVDPVDGTKEFIKRNGEFTVNIALVEGGRPALGIVLAPALGEAYVGVVGEGAWKVRVDSDVDQTWASRKPIPQPREVGRPFTVVASRSHMSPETEMYVDELRRVHGEVALISKGSSLKLCMVAEGVADAYPRFAPTMEWDTAAGQAVCEAAGFRVIDQRTGESMRYNREELLNAWFLVCA